MFNGATNFYNLNNENFHEFLMEMYRKIDLLDKDTNYIRNHLIDELRKELRKIIANGELIINIESVVDDFLINGLAENKVVRDIKKKLEECNSQLELKAENKVVRDIKKKLEECNSQLDTNTNDIKNIAVSVKNFNADDKGILDASKSFEDANAFNNSVYVANGTFRISTNTNIGTLVVGKNGYILVDENIVFTVDTVVCNKSQLVFKGSGKISIRDNTYSVAWYEGNTVNKKWDFLRKDFESGKPYTVVFPVPDINDSAYHSSTISPHAWKLDAPLIFDDAENIGKVYFESELYAINSVDKMVYFSPLEKTEDIDFPLGVKLNGNNLANYGLYFDGGARLKFYNTTRIIQCGTNVYAPCNTASIDEVEFKFLNVTGFKNIGVHFDCKNIGIGVKIDYLFSNGCQEGGSNILLISGILRGFSCNKFMQVIGTPYVDVNDSNIRIEPNTYGSCRLLVPVFNDILIFNSSQSILKALGNSNYKVSFVTNKISSMTTKTTDYKELILLDNCENCTIENVTLSDSTKNYIEVRENCKNIRINNTPSKLIKKPVNCEELYINGEKYAYVSLNNETVAKLYHPSNGLIKISSNASNLYGLLMCNTATIQNLVSSDLINVTTGILTGTTGVSGKLNISFNGNYIYIENRVGNPRNLIIGVSDLNNQLQ